MDDAESGPVGGPAPTAESTHDRLLSLSETLIRYVEVVAALVIVVLFAIGVFDLGLQRLLSTLSGRIIFRTGEYGSERAAILAAGAYTLLIFGLAALLVVERRMA